MKDIIVIEDRDLVNHYKNSFDSKAKLVSVPETFEELKELCKGLKEEDILVTNDCIVFRDLNFYKSGIICVPDSEYFSISQGRTPQQMWNIIKSLVGE